ncbi:hypothetical protein M419DRAFT_123383 [Trichoderma reesei RUT C-30]|uniref:Uncharacterized protein n=1 Tax=Hypocrea jecorina (strain ATCC 56765 / BCRC 32924 / NRRL 11460 / Rut C-30) TaxID=1344414 RepID=A0A024S9P0_HYPJR|nr:hypothetical protein M419DRAFT_123383 [Trichoderma reesei RUT C-30]
MTSSVTETSILLQVSLWFFLFFSVLPAQRLLTPELSQITPINQEARRRNQLLKQTMAHETTRDFLIPLKVDSSSSISCRLVVSPSSG